MSRVSRARAAFTRPGLGFPCGKLAVTRSDNSRLSGPPLPLLLLPRTPPSPLPPLLPHVAPPLLILSSSIPPSISSPWTPFRTSPLRTSPLGCTSDPTAWGILVCIFNLHAWHMGVFGLVLIVCSLSCSVSFY